MCNWSLLFDVALSHGDSLREQRLRYCGLMTLLRSAALLGPQTGVYQFLVDALWQLHGQPLLSAEGAVATKKSKALSDLAVDFEGFLEIMNVVCVRCYQTQRCTELLDENYPTSDAILLSAEDQVKLKESVAFTTRHFFKPLINRCIVSKKMVVSLDSMKNDWTPYTNHFVAHVVASSADSIIFPLFGRYAEGGRLYRAAFERMVSDVFPNFTEIQKKSAESVFSYSGFFGIHHLMEHCSLDIPEGRALALELDSFAEALLMLGVVAFSNELEYIHHRPITAKVWAVFENYYSKFVGVKMIDDPTIDNRFAFVLPAISLVFPLSVPLDKVSSFIIGGWNLTVDKESENFLDVDQDDPPRILHCDVGRRDSDGKKTRRKSKLRSPSTAGMASKFFEEELCRPSPIQNDLRIYGMRRCSVYVDQHPATTCQRGPNRVEVVIPKHIWDISIHTTRVYFVESGREGKLTLSPITKAVVSLRDPSGNEVYSSKDVTFEALPLEEKISELHVQELKAIFELHSTEGVMLTDQFDLACVDLCVAPLAAQLGGCASFLRLFWERRRDDGLSDDENARSRESSLVFAEFVSAMATLLLCQVGAGRCLSNISYLLAVAVSRASQKLPTLRDCKSSGDALLTPQLPSRLPSLHNARIDVPYTNALRRKDSSLRFHSGVENLLTSVKDCRKSVKLLPSFPAEAKTVALVSQYDDDEGGLRDKVKAASALLREAFLKKEMVVCRQGLKTE